MKIKAFPKYYSSDFIINKNQKTLDAKLHIKEPKISNRSIEENYKSCIEQYFSEEETSSLSLIDLYTIDADLLNISEKEIHGSSVIEAGLPIELWKIIIFNLGILDLLRISVVSKIFNSIAKDILETLWDSDSPFQDRTEINEFFRRFPTDYLTHLHSLNIPKTIDLYNLTKKTTPEKLEYFNYKPKPPEDEHSYNDMALEEIRNAHMEKMVSNENCILLLLGYFTLNDAMISPALLSPIAITALKENLITVNVARSFESSDVSVDHFSSLQALFTENGLYALRKKLIIPKDVSSIYNLDTLVSKDGLYMLEKGLLSIPQVILFSKSPDRSQLFRLKDLTTKEGIIALEKKLITVEQAMQVQNLKSLLSKLGLYALEKKLISPEEAKEFDCLRLQHLISQNGITGLESRVFTVQDALQFRHFSAFSEIIKDENFRYIRSGLFPMTELHKIDSCSHHTKLGSYIRSNGQRREEKINIVKAIIGEDLYNQLSPFSINQNPSTQEIYLQASHEILRSSDSSKLLNDYIDKAKISDVNLGYKLNAKSNYILLIKALNPEFSKPEMNVDDAFELMRANIDKHIEEENAKRLGAN